MTWTPPSLASPALNNYLSSYNCHRLCEQTLGFPKVSNSQISSPYTITGVDPNSYCVVDLIGIYGNHQISLAITTTHTFSSGNIYIHSIHSLIATIIMLLLYIYSAQCICY